MAADILFSHDAMWSCQRSGFEDLMQRAKRHCRGDAVVLDVLDEAEVVGCLALDEPRDIRQKRRLAGCVAEAAAECLSELQSDPDAHPASIASIQRLTELARREAAEGADQSP